MEERTKLNYKLFPILGFLLNKKDVTPQKNSFLHIMYVIAGVLSLRLLFLTLSPMANRVISVPSQMSTTTKEVTREQTSKIKSASWTDSELVWSMLPMSKRTKGEDY